jgi:hypothetical protein
MGYDIQIDETSHYISFNHAWIFKQWNPGRGIKCIAGMTGRESLFLLEQLNEFLETNKSNLEAERIRRFAALGKKEEWGGDVGFVIGVIKSIISEAKAHPKKKWLFY